MQQDAKFELSHYFHVTQRLKHTAREQNVIKTVYLAKLSNSYANLEYIAVKHLFISIYVLHLQISTYR